MVKSQQKQKGEKTILYVPNELHTNKSEAYTDGFKKVENKLGFVGVFLNSNRIGFLLEEVFYTQIKYQ